MYFIFLSSCNLVVPNGKDAKMCLVKIQNFQCNKLITTRFNSKAINFGKHKYLLKLIVVCIGFSNYFYIKKH